MLTNNSRFVCGYYLDNGRHCIEEKTGRCYVCNTPNITNAQYINKVLQRSERVKIENPDYDWHDEQND